jgi:hypothetical protein
VKKAKTQEERLIGAFGGAGGTLIFSFIFNFFAFNRFYPIFLIVGTALVATSIIIRLGKNRQIS